MIFTYDDYIQLFIALIFGITVFAFGAILGTLAA